jgi:hypothetical protein
MSEKPRAKAGATPGKLAVVGLLAVVLVGVVWKNFFAGGGEKLTPRVDKERPQLAASAPAPAATPTTPATSASASKGAAGSNAAAASEANPFGDFAVDQNWREPTLGEITKHDPFAAATWAGAQAESAEDVALTEKRINELMESKDAIIFMAGGTRVARIGKQEFRVGDRLGRYTISAITSQGVVLSER